MLVTLNFTVNGLFKTKHIKFLKDYFFVTKRRYKVRHEKKLGNHVCSNNSSAIVVVIAILNYFS